MSQAWSRAAAEYLRRSTTCPRCDAQLSSGEFCGTCGADLRGEGAIAVMSAGLEAADAIDRRQAQVDRLTEHPAFAQGPRSAGAPATAVSASAIPGSPGVSIPVPVVASTAAASDAPHPVPATAPPRDSISVQSVLAVVGAALLAVAAIVFTFFNPDLRDDTTRTVIIAIVTLVFLGSAGLMARTSLRFSAEAVGALGGVFVALDVYGFASQALPTVDPWALGGIGTVVSAVGLIAIGVLSRIRTWLWLGVVGVVITPAMFGYAVLGDPALADRGAVVGHLGVGALALAVHALIPRLGARFGSALLAERRTATVIQLLVIPVVLTQLVVTPVQSLQPPAVQVLVSALIVAVLAVLAGLSPRWALPTAWSALAGALGTVSAAILPLAITSIDSSWQLAIVPAAAAVAVAALSAVRPPAPLRRVASLIGAWAVMLATGIPAFSMTLFQILEVTGGSGDLVQDSTGLLGLVGLGLGSAALWWFSRRSADTEHLARAALGVGLWIAVVVALGIGGWPALPLVGRASAGLAIALGVSLLLIYVPRFRGAPGTMRAPLIVAVHLLPLMATVIAASEEALLIPVGAAATAVWIAAAQTAPQRSRPLHTIVGYAYALAVVAAAPSNAGVELIAVLCLTTSLASLAALVATLVRRIDRIHWWAILLVTSVPFLIGIVTVVAERSGWTGLSTAVTFALALTLVLTRRPGLNVVVRGLAAAILVPALAVVVISLGAQFLEVSGSPITLPIIAAIVAIVLPLTTRIGAALERHGISAVEARTSRLAIEASSILTAVIAVLLALVRAAAGFDTSFTVLVILGLGAGATALFARRPYGWWLSFASFTGALWCFLALSAVTVVEPYVLPPALVAALIGAVLVIRGRRGTRVPAIGLYWLGLLIAPLPTLGLLAAGSDVAGAPVWRAPALLIGAVALIALAVVFSRAARGLVRARRLVLPTLVVALAAVSAGAVEAVRVGRGLDAMLVPVDEPGGLVMLPVLGLSVLTAGIAAVVGGMLARVLHPRVADPGSTSSHRTSSRPVSARPVSARPTTADSLLTRWYYLPALVFLVAGPIAAVRRAWLPIWTLWGLAVALLILMLVIVAIARTRRVTLPPAWAVYAIAWLTAVAGWSIRDLRVEVFSLPLGVALLAAGVIAMRPFTGSAEGATGPRATLDSWPIGFSGSWRLLAPGIVATLIPSMLATGTDPQTWRAITVLGLALVAILIGSLRKLGAPFILGIAVLPIEILIVFAVQIGTTISSTWWWITLATAGAVLLVIATTYERRNGSEGGIAARMRDLA